MTNTTNAFEVALTIIHGPTFEDMKRVYVAETPLQLCTELNQDLRYVGQRTRLSFHHEGQDFVIYNNQFMPRLMKGEAVLDVRYPKMGPLPRYAHAMMMDTLFQILSGGNTSAHVCDLIHEEMLAALAASEADLPF